MINRVHKKGNAKYTNYQKPNPLKSGANWVHMSSTLFWVTSTKARIRRCIILPLNTTHFLCLINPHTNQYYLTSPSSVLSYYNNLIQVKKNLMSPQQALVSFRVNCPAFHFFFKKKLKHGVWYYVRGHCIIQGNRLFVKTEVWVQVLFHFLNIK